MTAKVVQIGSGAGFAGDRADAAVAVVETLSRHDGPKYLMYEVMGERTLAIAQLLKQSDPSKGYSPWLDSYLSRVLAECKVHGIRIVANFGNANPRAGALRAKALAAELSVPDFSVAYVEGDDLMARWQADALSAIPTIEGTEINGRPILGANAYLGAAPIVDALAMGVDLVVVGRTTDAALALAPLIHEFGWSVDDHDRLASGTVAGHLLECGAQVTGGYFADPGFKDVPDLHRVGFPVASITADGDIMLTKADNTGGVVSRATVVEQLLYEVHNPFAYLTPDVTVNYESLTVTSVDSDVVRISGAKGLPPPETLKVTMSVDGGWLGEAEITYAGPNAYGRADLARDVLQRRCDMLGIGDPIRIELIGTGSVHNNDRGSHNTVEPMNPDAEFRVRLALRSMSKLTAETAINECLALYCCGPAAGGGVRQHLTPQVSTASALIDRELIEPWVRVVGV